MKMRQYAGYLMVALAIGLVLGGCARMKKAPLEGAATSVEKAASSDDLAGRPASDIEWEDIDKYGSAWGVVKRIHFDYDKSAVKKEWLQGLTNNAKFMNDNPEFIMRIEGHCDERGTYEYNLALGDRRAMAARKFLIEKGVAGERIHIISYGEERPIAFCHEESCWWQNRRADFLVAKKK